MRYSKPAETVNSRSEFGHWEADDFQEGTRGSQHRNRRAQEPPYGSVSQQRPAFQADHEPTDKAI